MNAQLPGGLVTDGRLARGFAFLELDGRIELAICDASKASTRLDQVTQVLAASLAEVAAGPPSVERIDELCVADRQFLVRHLVRLLAGEPVWMTSSCQKCSARFDFQLAPSELPFSSAGPTFPRVRLEVAGGLLELRAPNGGDQRWLAVNRPSNPREALIERCITTAPSKGIELDEALLARIDAALEVNCPEVAVELNTQCPECGETTRTTIDPYRGLPSDAKPLLRDVHRLASVYHWSEPQILGLPRERRQQYLAFIDESRGMVT